MRLNDFTISPQDAVSVPQRRQPIIYDERQIRSEMMCVLDVLRDALLDAQRLLDLIERELTPRL
jgi:hypothetical protein